MRARPIDDDLRRAIDEVARARGFPATSDVAALGSAVAELSAIYNDTTPKDVRASDATALAARLGFSFARDVPKGEAAVAELVALDALPVVDGRLTVLDLGAGLGAMTWGLARALDRAGRAVCVEVELVDRDTSALALAQRILTAKGSTGGVTFEPRYTPGGAGSFLPRAPVGVVLVGQVLSELDRDRAEEERVARHVDLLERLVRQAIAPGGAVVVVEPALRDRTRHLHRVRDELLARGVAHVFAPCTHAGACPALADPTDWCHEDLPVDLPEWLAPVARAAGLRFQGLTFSYLVLRADARSVAEIAPVRVVSDLLRTKGKSEAFLCGALAAPSPPGRVRGMRLDRERNDGNADWDELGRGDLVTLEPLLEPKPGAKGARLPVTTRVRRERVRAPGAEPDADPT